MTASTAKKITRRPKKNIILFVGRIEQSMLNQIDRKKYRCAVLYGLNQKKKDSAFTNPPDITLSCDISNLRSVQQTLLPYQSEFVAVTCRGEENIPMFADILAFVPYLKTPTKDSLTWSTEKVSMRRMIDGYNSKLTPKYMVVTEVTQKMLQKIDEKIGFPLIVKPSGLSASRLVSICYHKKELEDVLKKAFKVIDSVYKQIAGRGKPMLLVEKFIDGDLFSTDAYVDSVGNVTFLPFVEVTTGKKIGFDDFFGYKQMTPAVLNEKNITLAQDAAKQAVRALGLRSTVAHIELMRTEDEWKIVELGPRIGGFRQKMYELSFGINHSMNDVLTRMDKKPVVPKKLLGYSVAMKFFAKQEGRLTALKGIKRVQELDSFESVVIHKKIGDMCKFAKHGGNSVFNIILHNKERSKLLADIRRLEQMINIETE